MSSRALTFDDDVLEVVDSFLQTVVVVDDRAFVEPAPSPIIADDKVASGLGGRAVRSDLQAPAEGQARSEEDEHDLDAKRLTDAFARDGLICGLLEPRPGSPIDEELLGTARRADLVVIDWILDRDNGVKALKLIRRMLADEAESPERQRLRTIAIYTGQNGLLEIAGRVRKVLESFYPEDELMEEDDGLALTKGPVRIAVFAKENASDLPAHLSNRRISIAEFPSRLRKEFAALTSGLITSVAIAALAALRDDTHRILRVLNPGLDAAYLGHRSALPTPREAERHAAALVTSELRSVIEDHDVGQRVREEVLLRWVTQRKKNDGLKPGKLITENAAAITEAQIIGMLRRGLGDDVAFDAIQEMGSLSKSKWRIIKKHATEVFALTQEEAEDADAGLARCMMLKTIYARPERILQLGTVLRTPEGEHLVCVQPVCDSVRLKADGRKFPFLKLKVSSRERSNLVLRGDGDEWHYFLIATNPRDIVVLHFGPQPGKDSVLAAKAENEHVVKDVLGQEYRWICQLKQEFAQKVAVDLASEFAQVAVDEAELLRLSR
jgi:hypothetical protein